MNTRKKLIVRDDRDKFCNVVTESEEEGWDILPETFQMRMVCNNQVLVERYAVIMEKIAYGNE